MAPETMDFGLCQSVRAVLQFLDPLTFIIWTWLKPLSLKIVSVDPFHIFLCPNLSLSTPQIDHPEELTLIITIIS